MTVSYRLVVRLSRIAALGGFLIVFVPLAWIAGPTVEARLFPIIETASAGEVGGGRTVRPCWHMNVRKARAGTPEYVSYFVHWPGGGSAAITPYYAETGELVATPVSRHAPGERWKTHYCADLPPSVVGKPGLTITGTIHYRTWHGIWLVPMTVPDVPLG